MMNFKQIISKKSVLSVAAALSFSILATPSHAFFGLGAAVVCNKTPQAVAQHQSTVASIKADNLAQATSVKTHFTTELMATRQALILALQMHAGQLSGNIKETIAADTNLAQTQDERARQREIEVQKMETLRESETPPSACRLITMARKNTVYGNGEAVNQYFNVVNTVNKLNDIDLGVGAATGSTSGASNTRNVLYYNAGKYCSEAQINAGTCGAVVPEELQNAHINASKSIMSGYQYSNTQIEEACADFILMSNGTVLGGVPAQAVDISPAQGLNVHNKEVTRARRSLSENALMGFCSRRKLINQDVTGELRNAIEKNPLYAGRDLSQGVSDMLGFMAMSSRWTSDADWAKELAADPAKAQKETALILSWIAYQNSKIYERLDEQSALQAAQLASLAELVYLIRNEQISNGTLK